MSESGFSLFSFHRLDPAYRRLMANERVVARQDFLASADTMENRSALTSYACQGLRADCDVMFLTTGPDLEALRHSASKLLSAGLGRYLQPSRSFLAQGAPGGTAKERGQYLFAQPVWRIPDREASAMKRLAKVKTHVLPLLGLGGPEALLIAEMDDPKELAGLAAALRESPAVRHLLREEPSFPCVRHDLRDLLDTLG